MMKISKSKFVVNVFLVFSFLCSQFFNVGFTLVNSAKQVFAALTSSPTNTEESQTSLDIYGGELYVSNYDSETIDATYPLERKPATFGNHEASFYPSINNVLNLGGENVNQFNEIITENAAVMANVEDDIANNNLRKHVSADGQFYGTIPDGTPRITKTITVNRLMSSRHWLGVFAPAGEVLTVKVEEKAIEQTKNNNDDNKLTIIIGYPYPQENNIRVVSSSDDRYSRMQNAGRMPYLSKEFKLTQTVTKIGSPFGGMIFLADVPSSVLQNFKITIEGGVDNPSYKLGVSQKSDWAKVLASPSPMVYIQTPYVNFMASKTAVKDVADPDNAIAFWNKAAMVSNYAMSLDTLEGQIRPVIMIFDNFVPSGSALCYPGLFAAICPTGWITSSLDYNNMVTSTGGWGTIHEMNHNFQYPLINRYHGSRQWSVGSGYNDYMEITNNVNNVMAYILYTDIAATRTEVAAPSNGGWGITVDPYYNLKHLLECEERVNDKVGFASFGGDRIYAYVDLIHSFGVDKFLHFLRQMGGGEETPYLDKSQTLVNNSYYMRTEDNFAVFASKYFQRNMVSYFKDTLHFDLSETAINEINNLNLEAHVSLQNLYAMGETDALTGKPFLVDFSTTTMDLKLKDMTVTTAEKFEIASIEEVVGGTVVPKDSDGIYTLTFNDNSDQVTFNIKYQAWLKESDSTPILKTLKVCIKKEVNFSIEATEYNYNKSQDGTDIANLIATKSDSDIKNVYRAGSLSTSVTSGETFTKLSANVVFPKDQQVTFMVYGDDITAIKIGDQLATCTTCVDYSFEYWWYDVILSWTSNKLTINVKANVPVLLEAFCLNTGGGGEIKVVYSVGDSNSYSGFLLYNCVSPNATQKEVDEYLEKEANPHIYDAVYDLQENSLERFYTSGVDHTASIESVKAYSENGTPLKNNRDATHVLENIYDGNSSTWFSIDTNYYRLPHFYVFKFKERVAINNVTVKFYSLDYAIRGYEYYVGDTEDQNDWTHVFTRENPDSITSFVDTFSPLMGQYFIIKVTHSAKNGQTNFVDITFNQSLDEGDKANIYSSKEEQFSYSSDWETQDGTFINGKAKKTENGEVTFVLEGEDMLLYSLNDKSEVYIDSEKFDVKANDNINNPSLFVRGLSNTLHTVKIVGKNMVFDAVKTTGAIHSQTSLKGFTLNKQVFEYDGTSHKPSISLDGKELVENVDYVFEAHKDTRKVGVVDFTIKGIGFYKGEFTSSFINHLDVDALSQEQLNIAYSNKQYYTGKEIQPKLNITIDIDGDKLTLVQGEDYDVEFADNIELGNASMQINFKGAYSGSTELNFEIVKKFPVGIAVGAGVGGTASVGLGIFWALKILKKKKKI